jgi:hypothetical protein
MASVSITNQTLTLTIDINGVETVIRKDNCKVVAIGDVVRITDYRGSIYEFLFSDCTAPDEASANDLRDAIEVFLNTAGGGGGGGLSSIESTTLDVSIADGVATVNVINDVFTPTISNITADATVSISDCFYVELGKWANMSFVLDCQMDLALSTTTFDVSLPFTTSGVSILTFGNQSGVVDNILSTATGASVSLNVQSLNAGDNIEKLEVSINFFLA